MANDRAKCSLIMAKSNLAPIRPSTIQRMELNGALTAARLSRTITDELKLNIVRTVFWTDSTTVLRWINSASLKFKSCLVCALLKCSNSSLLTNGTTCQPI